MEKLFGNFLGKSHFSYINSCIRINFAIMSDWSVGYPLKFGFGKRGLFRKIHFLVNLEISEILENPSSEKTPFVMTPFFRAGFQQNGFFADFYF